MSEERRLFDTTQELDYEDPESQSEGYSSNDGDDNERAEDIVTETEDEYHTERTLDIVTASEDEITRDEDSTSLEEGTSPTLSPKNNPPRSRVEVPEFQNPNISERSRGYDGGRSACSMSPTRNFDSSTTTFGTLDLQTPDISQRSRGDVSITMSELNPDISQRSRGDASIHMSELKSPDTSQRSRDDPSASVRDRRSIAAALEASALQLEDLIDSAMLESGALSQDLVVSFAPSETGDVLVDFDPSARPTHADSDEDEDSVSSGSSSATVSYEERSCSSADAVTYEVKPEQSQAAASDQESPQSEDKGELLVGFNEEKPESEEVIIKRFSSSLHQSGLLDVIEEDEEEGLFENIDKQSSEERRRSRREMQSGGSSWRSAASDDSCTMKKPASFRSFQSADTSVQSEISTNNNSKSMNRKLIIMFGMLLVTLASLTFIAVFLTEVVRQGQGSNKMVDIGADFYDPSLVSVEVNNFDPPEGHS